MLVPPLILVTFVYHFPLAKEETRHSWMLLAQLLVRMLNGLTLDSPLQVSSEEFQICCPQRSEDTEILFVYRLELKSWSCWNPWQTSQRLQSGLDSTLTGQSHLIYSMKDQRAYPARQKLM